MKKILRFKTRSYLTFILNIYEHILSVLNKNILINCYTFILVYIICIFILILRKTEMKKKNVNMIKI